MLDIGKYHHLRLMRETKQGAYLDDGEDGILLPTRFVPAGAKFGDLIEVFVYHDKEGRPICTTQKPIGKLGDIVLLKAVTVTPQGAFLDNGLMKDLFVPGKNQLTAMVEGGEYLVKIYLDELSNRLSATERLDKFFSNDTLTVEENDEVELLIYRKTPIGYQVIINQKHLGVLHTNEVYRDIRIGDRFKGHVKKILAGNKIDVVAGKSGYRRVEDEASKIMRLLDENNGYLPYHDKSSPEEIYSFFSMSKKAFKMTLGNLYKQKKIMLDPGGIRRVS
ncbi:MAG: GntR family transcriptional regulator [Saprospiraceae bacterium]|nr:GntR family transcriptional regulator [Saprospiraceae bacterium]